MSENTASTTWMPESVYSADASETMRAEWPPFLDANDINSMRISRNPAGVYEWFTPEFCAAVASERSWSREAPLAHLPADAREVVMQGQPCPVCGSSSGGKVRGLHRGVDTGIEMDMPIPCGCGLVVRFRTAWNKQMSAHRRFTNVRLPELEPHAGLALDLETQAKIIGTIRAAPDDSYLLVGPPNTGKSHIMSALFRRALASWAQKSWLDGGYRPAVWRISAAQLLDEHVAWDTRDRHDDRTTMPTVPFRAIQACAEEGYRPCLFLDELDKIVPTDYKVQKLIAIVDAVYEAEGQICATSNKTPQELVAKWGLNEAGTVIRRIGGGPGAHTINFSAA